MKRCIVTLVLALAAVGCGGSGGPGGGVVDPTMVRLQDVQTAVFTPRCALSNCHVGTNAPFGLDLSSGQAMGNLVGVASSEQPQFDRIEPGNAANSYVFMKLTADARITGDPMPASGGALSTQQLQLIEDWIVQGANP